MKNKSVIILLLIAGVNIYTAVAQDLGSSTPNYNEWMKQRKTQRKYLTRQIVALQTYHELLKKGYDICKHGLGNISDLKASDFSQHKGYFNSLSEVKPAIARSKQVQEILTWETTLNKEMKSLVTYASRQSEFSSEEKRYFDQIATNVRTASINDLDQLGRLITSGKTSMADDDRMNRITLVHQSSSSRHSFVRNFKDQAMSLAAQRRKDKQELDYSIRFQTNL